MASKTRAPTKTAARKLTQHVALDGSNFITMRQKTVDEMKRLLDVWKSKDPKRSLTELQIGQVTHEIEEAIFLETVKQLIQNSDTLPGIYQNIVSNFMFNLEHYQNSDQLVSEIIVNPEQSVSRIFAEGPLMMNRQLPEIAQQLSHISQDGGRARYASNTGGLIKCPRCHKSQVYRQLVQDRGGDEAFSSYFSCLNTECGHEWRRGG